MVHLYAGTIYFCQKPPSYANEALNQQSCMSYVLTSAASDVKNFDIADQNVNFTDRLPLIFEIVVSVYSYNVSNSNKSGVSTL